MMKKLTFLSVFLLVFTAVAMAQPASSTQPASTSTASSTTTKKPPVFRPTKDQIKQVQTILKDKKMYTGDASGSYNDDTRTGIKKFQKDNGLKETGTLNRATLEKFGVALTNGQKAIPVSQSSFADAKSSSTSNPSDSTSNGSKTSGNTAKKAAPFRATDDQIKAAQKLLKDGKMYAGDQTGKLDDSTREGLGKYQQANNIKVTKTLNALTLEKMGIALTDKQKADAAAAPKK